MFPADKAKQTFIESLYGINGPVQVLQSVGLTVYTNLLCITNNKINQRTILIIHFFLDEKLLKILHRDVCIIGFGVEKVFICSLGCCK